VATELPIACSLSPGDRATRQLEWASLSDRLIELDRRNLLDITLRFRRDSETRSLLTRLVEAERDCCPFLDLELTPPGSDLALSIRGPKGAEQVIEGLIRGL
jgi:hypothetical protein